MQDCSDCILHFVAVVGTGKTRGGMAGLSSTVGMAGMMSL